VPGAFSVGGNVTAGAANRMIVTSPLFSVGGTLTCSSSGEVDFEGPLSVAGTTVISAGTVYMDGPATLAALTLTGGDLRGTATVTVTGLLSWTGGRMIDGGRTVAAGSMSIGGNGTKSLLDSRKLDNGGTATWTGSGDIQLNNGAALRNLAGALFDAQTDRTFANVGGATPNFNNAGTLRKSAGTGTTIVQLAFTNTGTVEAQTGILSFVSSYVQTAGATVLAGGTIAASLIDIQGGSLSGSGTINAAVRNGGIVSPGGVGPGGLTISGNYTQLTNGMLNIELGGLAAGSQYDQLVINGSAALDGTVNVTLIDGFAPNSGNLFLVLIFTSRTGTFATLNGPDLSGGQQLAPAYDATDFTLTVVTG
jgi:hypothetical protein